MRPRSLKGRIRAEAERRLHDAELVAAHARSVLVWLDNHGSGPLPRYIRTAGERWGVK